MTKHKLKLKRTPEEEAQHRQRKERRKEKKRKWAQQGRDDEKHASSSKRFHADDRGEGPSRKWASSDEDHEMEYGPQPAASSSSIPPLQPHAHKPDYDTLRAEIEEQKFRQKMFDALGDDERLDSLEASFNEFGHLPDRWRNSSSGLGTGTDRAHHYDGDDFLKMDPRNMDDEEYAEWIRIGMYRKTHADEYAEQQRQKAARAAKRAEEKARKAETARLEKIAEEERKFKKTARELRRMDDAREEYNIRWAALLATANESQTVQSNGVALSFGDIPWPIVAAHRQKPEKRHHKEKDEALFQHSIRVEDLTLEAISSFLLPAAATTVVGQEIERGDAKKERKDKLRETFLRFHPDKFEGRFMKRVKDDEKEKVREAIGQISRVLNSLMGEGG